MHRILQLLFMHPSQSTIFMTKFYLNQVEVQKHILLCLQKGKMSIKAVRQSGGFGIPPAHILEALSLRERFDVEYWKRRHVFNVIFPNEPPASVFNSEDDGETLVKETVLHGKKVNWGCKQGCQTVILMRYFN